MPIHFGNLIESLMLEFSRFPPCSHSSLNNQQKLEWFKLFKASKLIQSKSKVRFCEFSANYINNWIKSKFSIPLKLLFVDAKSIRNFYLDVLLRFAESAPHFHFTYFLRDSFDCHILLWTISITAKKWGKIGWLSWNRQNNTKYFI